MSLPINSKRETSLVANTLDQYIKYRSISKVAMDNSSLINIRNTNMNNCEQQHNFEQSLPRVCAIGISKNRPICGDVRSDLKFIAIGFEDSSISLWHHGPHRRSSVKKLNIYDDSTTLKTHSTTNTDASSTPISTSDSDANFIGRDISVINLAIDVDRKVDVKRRGETSDQPQTQAQNDLNNGNNINKLDSDGDFDLDVNKLVNFASKNGAMVMESLYGHSGAIHSVKFFKNSDFLLSCSADTTIRLWCLKSMCNITVYRGHVYPIWSLDLNTSSNGSDNYFVSGSKDTTARLWTTEKNYPIRIFSSHDGDVEFVKFHPNGKYIATGSTDTTARLWNVHDGKMVRLMVGHQTPVTSLTFSPNGKLLATASLDGQIRIWEISNNLTIVEHKFHECCPIYCLSFNLNQSILTICGHDSKLRHISVIPTPNHELLSQGQLDNKNHKMIEKSTQFTSLIQGHYVDNNIFILIASQCDEN